MKTFSLMLIRLLLLLVGWVLIPTVGSASETRVDATGGLTTILDDETDNLDLFLDGNPAGLLLLNTRDRFDLAGEWSYTDQEGPWGSNKQQIFTTIPRYTDNPIDYEGLMLFPDPHWAVQVLGDVFIDQGVTVANPAADTETTSQYRELVRAAYALPFAALGLELLDVEQDKAFDPGLYNPTVGIVSGSGSEDQWFAKFGFITTFPGPASPEDPRWQAGGYFETQLGPSPYGQDLNVYYLNSPSFLLGQTTTTTDYTDWGAELLYDLPSVARVRFTVGMVNSDSDFQQTVPYASSDFSDLAKYHLAQFQSMTVSGAFKLSLPFTESENVKLGGSVTGYFTNQDDIRPDGTVMDNKEKQQVATTLGIGLEDPKDYTMGLQWKSLSYTNGSDVIDNPGTISALGGVDYAYYQLVFGGEKWIFPVWALRLGLVGEVDDYTALSTSALTTTLNAGTGLEEAFGRLDFRFWVGSVTGLDNSADTLGLVGAELSTTLFL